MIQLKDILFLVIAYLLGSISPSTILGKMSGIDIKKEGSGNAGTTNALRVLGKKAAVITLVIDILKGFVAVKLAFAFCEPRFAYFAALFAFIGHIKPIFYHFKGGKGVAVAFGALLAIDPRIGLSCLGVVIVTVLITRMMSLGSILAALAFPIFATIWCPQFRTVGILMAITVIYAHRANIKRIIHGEENKISFKKK